MGDVLQEILHTNSPTHKDDTNQVMEHTVATAMYATWCSISTPIWTTTSALVYGRDILMDVPLIANLSAIWDGQQQTIDKNFIRQTKKI